MKCPQNPGLFVSMQLQFKAYVCFYPNCTAPDAVKTSGQLVRPANAVYWSNSSTWNGILGPQPTNGSSVSLAFAGHFRQEIHLEIFSSPIPSAPINGKQMRIVKRG